MDDDGVELAPQSLRAKVRIACGVHVHVPVHVHVHAPGAPSNSLRWTGRDAQWKRTGRATEVQNTRAKHAA
jgi:hypothetical protein